MTPGPCWPGCAIEQPAASHVLARLQQAKEAAIRLSMSWINVGEVYYMLARKHDSKTAEDFLTRLPSLPIRLVLPEEEDVIAAAELKSAHRLSYAHAFAVALAVKENAAGDHRRSGNSQPGQCDHGGVDRRVVRRAITVM